MYRSTRNLIQCFLLQGASALWTIGEVTLFRPPMLCPSPVILPFKPPRIGGSSRHTAEANQRKCRLRKMVLFSYQAHPQDFRNPVRSLLQEPGEQTTSLSFTAQGCENSILLGSFPRCVHTYKKDSRWSWQFAGLPSEPISPILFIEGLI